MKTDAQLKDDVIAELDWDPSFNASNVGVAVRNGVVTVTGHINTFAEKWAIERAVQRVSGVHALAVELDVKLSADHRRSDSEIAEAIELAFLWHVVVPKDAIRVKVDDGWVTLDGEVDWQYQRAAAERVARPILGVKGLYNNLKIKPHVKPSDIESKIREALTRRATAEAAGIAVKVTDSTAILEGTVQSIQERDAVQAAAWAAPGIQHVDNRVRVLSTT